MAIVNILTIVNEPNYGACLQGYALYETIQRMGHSPKLINLLIDYRTRKHTFINRILITANKLVKGYMPCYRKAREFTNKYMPNQTRSFHSLEELCDAEWAADEYYIVGSDQVWNPEITSSLSRAYVLSFLPEHCKLRYSYASSFGNIKDEGLLMQKLPSSMFARFKSLGVRESFGVEYLNRQGIEATEVIDPTLLIKSYSHMINGGITPKREMLFLALSDTKAQNDFVKRLSTIVDLPVNKLYGYLQPSREINSHFVSVNDWIKAIAESELVVSDSFHATVFAILFHRPFFVYISQPGKADRIVNLLDRLGISQTRIISNANDAIASEPIDYVAVEENLTTLRKKSLQFLHNIFEN